MPEYKPGVCNIGKNETRKRYAMGAAGFIMAAAFALGTVSAGLPGWVLLVSFIPLVIGFEGAYQGRFRFCAGFAAAGIYDFTGSGGSRKKVTGKEAHRKDMGMAFRIHAYSLVSGAVVAAIIYLLL
jgi:hypothetical protein